ncbi:MAG TPA: VIT domain-containing protein [Phycisphaerales bacterium]|nr:VIT domain-containing protein [Phycisphaerales bacterium]
MTIQRTNRRLGAICWLGALAPAWCGALAQDGIDRWENVVIPQHRVVLPPVRESSVRIESVDVDVRINEQVATTTVAILLRNPSPSAQESQLLMPVPDGATVRQFRLEGLPDEGIARLLTREEARRIYEDIVRRTRDPGLVEFVGLNLIRSSVFPVPASGTQRMELVYEQALPAEGSRVDYVLPRSESLERSGVDWSMSATIKSSREIGAVYSPSHDLATERLANGSVRVTVPASSADDPGAFRLSYAVAETDGLAASLIAYPDPKIADGEGGYFMLLLGVPAEAERPRMRREVTIVIDRSGSMRGEKMDQARNAALQILDALDDGEAFNIIDYSDTIESFSEASVVKTDETAAEAREYIEGIKAVGGTNIHDALVRALSAEPAEGTLPMVLFLTDGLPTVGVRSERDIREAARKANKFQRRIFSFGVGFDVNSPLLSHVATSSRGSPTFVLPDEDIEVKVGQVFRRLQGPVLARPELAAAGGGSGSKPVREVLPASLPDVFEGEQVTVLGQYLAPGEIAFTLTGTDAAGEEREYEATFDLASAGVQHSYVPRIWATRKIGTLIDEIRQSGAEGEEPSQELIDEVVRLSTEFGILTEYTAFLAAEENEFLAIRGIPASPEGGAGGRRRASAEALSAAPDERVGAGSVAQDETVQSQRDADRLNLQNAFRYSRAGGGEADGADGLAETSFVSVRQAADQTLYRRGDRWIDARLLDEEASEPERVIAFASDEYFELARRLAEENRQSVLAVEGDVYLLLDGQRTLVRQSP